MGSSNLAEILEAHPRQRVDFDLAKVDIGKLTLIELMDASGVSGVPFDDFRTAMVDEDKQVRLFYAIAWVILRREDKSLTYEQVCEYDLIVSGELDEEANAETVEQAKAVVAIASLAGTSPDQAKQMTMAEIGATVDLAQARSRAARRGRRK